MVLGQWAHENSDGDCKTNSIADLSASFDIIGICHSFVIRPDTKKKRKSWLKIKWTSFIMERLKTCFLRSNSGWVDTRTFSVPLLFPMNASAFRVRLWTESCLMRMVRTECRLGRETGRRSLCCLLPKPLTIRSTRWFFLCSITHWGAICSQANFVSQLVKSGQVNSRTHLLRISWFNVGFNTDYVFSISIPWTFFHLLRCWRGGG